MGAIICRPLRALVMIATAVTARAYFVDLGLQVTAFADFQDLAETARAAKATPTDVDPGAVEASRQRLQRAARQLDRYLATGGANGRAWKQYLHFDDLLAIAEVPSPPPPETMKKILRRFRADHVGLEMPVFKNVGDALESYMRVVREAVEPTGAAELADRLEQLATELIALSDPPKPDEVSQVGATLGWLSEHGQATELVAQVRSRLSGANLRVQVSEEIIATGSLREIKDRAMPVRDVILGTSIYGTGRTSGWVRTRLIPDGNRGLFETTITAVNQAQTVGYNGPARIGSNSTTHLSGTKRFYLDSSGFHVWGARSTADAHSQIYGIWSNKHGLMDRIVRKVASKRVGQQKRQAEQIASRHAAAQLNARLDMEANAQLGRAHADYTAKVRNPLVRLAQWPRELRMQTTAGQFRLAALHDLPAQLAAPVPAPAAPQDAAMVVQVHESLINNYGEGLLAGQTIRQQELDRLSLDLFGRRPAQLAHDEEKGPWAITFNNHEPLLLRVEGGKASLTIRGRRFKSEVRTIDTPLDITAHYRLLCENNAAKGVREGELEVYPTGFVPNGERKMSLRQSRDANFIRHRFDDFFTPEIASQGLVLPGQWGRTGRLDLVELTADRGWVTLAWGMGAKSEK